MAKLNKTSNLEKLANSALLGKNNFKKFIIVPAVLLLAAFVLLFTVGFNKSVEFAGGTAVRVFKAEAYTYNQMQNKIDSVLESNGLVASIYQEVEFEGNSYLSVKYKNDTKLSEDKITQLNNKIVNQLFEEFGYDQNNLEQENYVVGNQTFDSSMGKQAMINTFAVIVLATVFVILYFVIRFKHHTAMTVLLAIYHDLLMAISLALVFRVQINLTFMSALLFVLAFSLINNLLYFSTVRENVQIIEKGESAWQIASKSLKSHFKTQVVLVKAAVVALAVFMLVGGASTFSASLIAIFGVLASFYSLNFLVPALWAVVFVPVNKRPREKVSE